MPTAPYYEHAFDEFYRTTRINIGSDAKYKNAKDETRILASYNNYVRSKETIYKDLTDLSQTVVNSSGAQDTSVFDAILTKIVYSNYKIQNWKYQFGADLHFYTAQGERILNNDKEQSNLASFFTIEHKLNDIISLRGTLVPATTINRSIASIPLIGDLLVGKKVGEGVFGVSFKVKGPPKKLETTVNPIKTLTPRFITRTLEKIKKN